LFSVPQFGQITVLIRFLLVKNESSSFWIKPISFYTNPGDGLMVIATHENYLLYAAKSDRLRTKIRVVPQTKARPQRTGSAEPGPASDQAKFALLRSIGIAVYRPFIIRWIVAIGYPFRDVARQI
jgi:hypothetical protein